MSGRVRRLHSTQPERRSGRLILRILLLSAYHAASHKYWCDGLKKNFPEYRWTELQLAPRYFAWRVRGNPLSWATRYHDILAQEYDLVVATSMVDLACLRGLVPQLSVTPAVLYFHENQFAYPLSEQANSMLEAQLVSVYAAMSAQKIVFNSHYNRQSFLRGVEHLLKKLPDEKPFDLSAQLEAKSRCLVVPLDLNPEVVTEQGVAKSGKQKHIVWNHRWEYDKGPDRLLALLKKLDPGLPLGIHIVGQQFREQPAVFSEIKSLLEQRTWLQTWGYVNSREEYLALLARSDLVLSTAVHDFQGLAVLEACALGCLPVVPARLAYTEIFPEDYLYLSSPDNIESEAQAAAALVEKLLLKNRADTNLQKQMAKLTWSQILPTYRDLFESTARVEVSCASTKRFH